MPGFLSQGSREMDPHFEMRRENQGSSLPGTSVRNPARGKGNEEGSLTKCKAVIRLQGEPLKFPEHPPPKPESACRTTLCFSSTLLTLTGDLSPHHLFLGKVNKSPGHNTTVSVQKPL